MGWEVDKATNGGEKRPSSKNAQKQQIQPQKYRFVEVINGDDQFIPAPHERLNPKLHHLMLNCTVKTLKN